MENASDAVVQTAADDTVQWVSPSITKLLGWQPTDLVGHRAIDFLHPDDAPTTVAVQTQITRGDVVQFEARMRTADGKFRWMNSTARPFLDESGTIVGRVAAWRDSETEHRARAALAESEERFRLLAENASDVVYLVGPDRRVRWISPNVVNEFGWTVDELVGTSMYDLVHPEDRARIDAARDDVFAGRVHAEPAEGYLCRFRHKDGTALNPADSSVGPLLPGRGPTRNRSVSGPTPSSPPARWRDETYDSAASAARGLR